MYSLTSANRYYLYQGFVRMNLGIDGLFKIIRSQMKELSPISGDIFLFFGKNRQIQLKIAIADGPGAIRKNRNRGEEFPDQNGGQKQRRGQTA